MMISKYRKVMKKMTDGKIKEIIRLKAKIDKLYENKRQEYTDLFYRFKDQTFIRTLSNRQALKEIISATACKDHDTNSCEVLFECVPSGADPRIPDDSDLGRSILNSKMLELGINEKEKTQWLDALTTKN